MIKTSSTLFASIWDPHQNILLPPSYRYWFLQLFLKYTASAVWFHLVRNFSPDHRCTIPNDSYFLRDSFPDLECQTLCVNRKVEIRRTHSGNQESVLMVIFFSTVSKIYIPRKLSNFHRTWERRWFKLSCTSSSIKRVLKKQ